VPVPKEQERVLKYKPGDQVNMEVNDYEREFKLLGFTD
jgi:hypothetical protein